MTQASGSINQLLEGPPASPEGEADGGQAINIEVGLLLNFGRKAECKRSVYDNKRKKSAVISVDQWRGNYNTENRAMGRDAKSLF